MTSLFLVPHAAGVGLHWRLHLHDGVVVTARVRSLRAERYPVDDRGELRVAVGNRREKHRGPVCLLGGNPRSRRHDERRYAPNFRELFHEAAFSEGRID